MTDKFSFIDPNLKKFIAENSLEKRQSISDSVTQKYASDRVPVIVGRGELKNTPMISKNKYLAPTDLTFGQFMQEIRKNIENTNSKVALFFFFNNNVLVPSSAPMLSLYNRYKSDDGFLYIVYCAENTFG